MNVEIGHKQCYVLVGPMAVSGAGLLVVSHITLLISYSVDLN